MLPNCKQGFLQGTLVVIVLLSLGFGLTQIPVTKFTRAGNARQISAFSTFQTQFPEQCCHVCAQVTDCMAVSYNEDSEECELSRTTYQSVSTNSSAVGWNAYFKTKVNTSCIAESCFSFQDISQSWEAANNRCKEHYNGHLAYVKSSFINTFLNDLRVRHGISDVLWLGGNNDIVAGGWTDGTVIDSGFSNWDSGQANVNYTGSGLCIHFVSGTTSEWGLHPCGANNMRSICEFPANTSVQSIPHVSSINNNKP